MFTDAIRTVGAIGCKIDPFKLWPFNKKYITLKMSDRPFDFTFETLAFWLDE
jgi:hypothetical protein